jgi:hypothetical protein
MTKRLTPNEEDNPCQQWLSIELEGRFWKGLISGEKPFDVLAEGLLSENSRGDWI